MIISLSLILTYQILPIIYPSQFGSSTKNAAVEVLQAKQNHQFRIYPNTSFHTPSALAKCDDTALRQLEGGHVQLPTSIFLKQPRRPLQADSALYQGQLVLQGPQNCHWTSWRSFPAPNPQLQSWTKLHKRKQLQTTVN